MGKTSCALWLAQRVQHEGRGWLFVSLPAVKEPFRPNGLVDHLLTRAKVESKFLGHDVIVDIAEQENITYSPMKLPPPPPPGGGGGGTPGVGGGGPRGPGRFFF